MPTDTGATPGAPPPPPPHRPPPRRLVRFPDDGPLGGVCAGVADYLNVDPVLVRIVAIVLAITGPGIPAYVLGWIFVPAEDGTVMAALPSHPRRGRDGHVSQAAGLGLLAILVIILFSVGWGDWWEPAHGWWVPVGLIAVGAWILLRRHDDELPPSPPTPPTPPPAGPYSPWQATPPAAPISVAPAPFPPTGATEPTDAAPTTDPPEPTDMDHTDDPPGDTLTDLSPTDSQDAVDPTQSFAPGSMGWGPTPPGGTDDTGYGAGAPPPESAHVRHPRRRRVIGPVVFGALLLWAGIAWLAGVSAQDGLAVGLCITGLGFVVGAFFGGSRGLIFPALLIAFALIVVSTVDVPLGSGIGERNWNIANVRDLDRTYELSIGDATLDLRDLELPADKTTRVDVRVGIGHLTVIAPEDAALVIDTKAGAGSSDVLGREEGGSSVDTHRELTGDDGAGTLDLDLKVGLGRIDVRREPAAERDARDEAVTPSTTAPSTTTTLAVVGT